MSSPAQLHPELISRPRFCTRRNLALPTRGRLVSGVARLQGWPFYTWQDDGIDIAMEFWPATGFPHYKVVGISVARQNGKTTLVLARVGAQLIIPRSRVAYTAQDRGLARLKWQEHVELLMETPFRDRVAHIDTRYHYEKLVMHNGSWYLPMTPSKKAGRSLTIDLAVIDEAWAHQTMDIVGALQGTLVARPHAQLWLLSMAGTFESKLWNHYTDLGRLEVDSPASSMCWIEYSADPDTDVYDRQAWIDANPSLGQPGGVTEEGLNAAVLMDEDTFRREHLNIKTDPTSTSGIDRLTWSANYDKDLAPGARVALSLDITHERDRGTLTSAGMVGDIAVIEVIEATSDLDELLKATIETAQAQNAVVVINAASPAKSTVPRLEKARIAVRLLPMPEYSSACGDFYDAAKAATKPVPADGDERPALHRLAHNGDYRLADAVAAATKRKVGERWVWFPKAGADITALTSATMAAWHAVTLPSGGSAYDDEDAEVVV